MTIIAKTHVRWSGGPGTWFATVLESGTLSAMLNCPRCGRAASLADHEISTDGTVTPSVVCPFDPCKFHDSVRLNGWTGSWVMDLGSANDVDLVALIVQLNGWVPPQVH